MRRQSSKSKKKTRSNHSCVVLFNFLNKRNENDTPKQQQKQHFFVCFGPYDRVHVWVESIGWLTCMCVCVCIGVSVCVCPFLVVLISYLLQRIMKKNLLYSFNFVHSQWLLLIRAYFLNSFVHLFCYVSRNVFAKNKLFGSFFA